MTTYRLPDGTEIASLDVNGSMEADKAWVTHPTLGSILIDQDKLTEVKPPLPPEPGEDTVVVIEREDDWGGYAASIARGVGSGLEHERVDLP